MNKLFWALAIVSFSLFIVGNAGATMYTITDLGVLGTGTASYAMGVNTSGEVAGYAYYTTGTSAPHAVIWNNGGVMTDISGSLAAVNSRAFSVNDSGEVAGYLASPQHGFLYFNSSTVTDMSTLPGELNGASSRPTCVTDGGMVAGGGGTNGYGFVYNGTTSYSVGNLGGGNCSTWAVNDSNVAVGASMQGGIDPTTYATYSTFSGGSWTTHNLGAGAGNAFAINSSGTIVGQSGGSTLNYFGTGTYGFVAVNTSGSYTVTDLPTLGGSGNAAYSISNTGVAVGASSGHACIYTQSAGVWSVTDLDTLIPGGTGWTNLVAARGISTDGNYIVGYGTIGGQTHGFELSPVPEPSTIVLLGFAAVGLLGYVWRRRMQ